jgi:hypothetical protein
MTSFRNLCYMLCQNPVISYDVYYTYITYSFPVEISHGWAGVEMIPFNISSLIPRYVIENMLACRMSRIRIGQDKLVDH